MDGKMVPVFVRRREMIPTVSYGCCCRHLSCLDRIALMPIEKQDPKSPTYFSMVVSYIDIMGSPFLIPASSKLKKRTCLVVYFFSNTVG